MPPTISIIKDPFDYLDSYNDSAFIWANEVARKIGINKLKEKNPLIISTAFAYVFSVFLHFTMDYYLDDFESYLEENAKGLTPNAWKRMIKCCSEIYSAMKETYKDDYKIYLTLHDSILIEIPDEDSGGESATTKIEPYNYDELRGYGFVSEGFMW